MPNINMIRIVVEVSAFPVGTIGYQEEGSSRTFLNPQLEGESWPHTIGESAELIQTLLVKEDGEHFTENPLWKPGMLVLCVSSNHYYYTVGQTNRLSEGLYLIPGPGNGFNAEFVQVPESVEIPKMETLKTEERYNNPFTQIYTQDDSDGLSSRVVSYLKSKVIRDGVFDDLTYSGCRCIEKVISGHWPNFDPEKPGMVTVWLDQKARDKGRKGRTVMKYGKFLRKLFPTLEDSKIEELVDDYKERFTPPEIEILESDEESGFTEAYAGEIAPFRNLSTTYMRKSLANSCMRGEKFTHLPKHPACAYASGEFTIVYAKDKNNGKIHGRCVVWHGPYKPSYGPIYGVCEESINSIESYMKGKGYREGGYDGWIGANLKAIPHDGGFIAPYLDFTPQRLEENGNFLTINPRGDIEADDYSGVLADGGGCQCENCGDRIDPEYACFIEQTEQTVCDNCYGELTVYSEYEGESILLDDAVEVKLLNGSTDWMFPGRGCDHIARLNEWWEEDAIHFDAYGELFTQKEMDDGEWIECTWSSEFYPEDEISYTTEGDAVETQALKDDPSWQLNEDGEWENIQIDMELEKSDAA